MSIAGYYYLHTNGDLIYKREIDGTVADLRESDFVRAFWPMDTKNREHAWSIVVEALALGANKERVLDLANKWGCDDHDAMYFAYHVGFILKKDGDQFVATRKDFVDLQSSPSGYGDTALYAMADLAKKLGYRAQKTWGASFADLVRVGEDTINAPKNPN